MSAPRCQVDGCTEPVTCRGRGDGPTEYTCDAHCDHGAEDGAWPPSGIMCEPLSGHERTLVKYQQGARPETAAEKAASFRSSAYAVRLTAPSPEDMARTLEQWAEVQDEISRQGTITIVAGTWAKMTGDLLAWAIRLHGSQRKAAKALGVPRSTLGAWVKRARS